MTLEIRRYATVALMHMTQAILVVPTLPSTLNWDTNGKSHCHHCFRLLNSG